MVNNLADFAKIFEAKVCVEGIETSGMRDILREYGINCFQGYYYSKPVPQDDFLTIIRNGKISGASVSL